MSRTNYTSETLRLETSNSVCNKESERTNNQHLQASVLSASQGYQKKKVSSFQITSIRPTSRSSNDGADDSENDTEDTSDILDSSRVTIDLDQETPSYSEDYSKSEDLLLATGPVIPASSQYGITALVQQTGTSGMMTARLPQGVTVNVTEGGLALAKADGEPDDLDNWQKRFKIVKIDSTEPFKRGRWICLDFMDSPALSSSENKSEELPNLVVSNVVLTDGGSSDQAHRFVQIPLSLSTTVQYPSAISHSVPNQYSGQVQTSVPVASSQVPPVQGGAQYPQSTGQPIQIGVPPGFAGTQASQGSAHATPLPVQSSTPTPSSISQSNISSNAHSKSEVQQNTGINASCISQDVPVGIQPGMPSHSISSQPSVPATQQSEQSASAQTINIPQQNLAGGIISQGLQTQVMGISQNSAGIQSQQPQQQPQPNQQPLTNQGIPQSTTSAQQISQPNTTQMQSQIHSTQHIGVNQPSNNGQQIPNSLPGSSSQSSTITSQLPSGSSSITSTIQAASYTSLPGTGATPTPATTPAQTQMNLASGQSSIQGDLIHQIQQGSSLSSTASSHPSNLEGITLSSQGGEASSSNTATPPTGVAGSEEAESFRGLARALYGVAFVPNHDHHQRSSSSASPPTFAPHTSSTSSYARPSSLLPSPTHCSPAASLGAFERPSELLLFGAGPERQGHQNSASTASTVAIDNKIEQAMDLVKSHLMFAVREEVDVLKDRIVELMDRIKHLECENTILRQYASPEVLQQLQSQMPHQMQQPSHHSSTS